MCGSIIDYETFRSIEKNIGKTISCPNSLVMLVCSDAFFDDVSMAFLKSVGSPPPVILKTRALPYRDWKVEIVVSTVQTGTDSLKAFPTTWIAAAFNFAMAGE